MIGLTRAGQGRTKGRMWPVGRKMPRSAVDSSQRWERGAEGEGGRGGNLSEMSAAVWN